MELHCSYQQLFPSGMTVPGLNFDLVLLLYIDIVMLESVHTVEIMVKKGCEFCQSVVFYYHPNLQ